MTNGMTEQIQVGDQIINYDLEKTKTCYRAMESGDAERCGCSYCKNFAAQRTSVYPKDFRLLLDQLGIDPDKEGEVYELGPDGSQRLYGGWFYFVGDLAAPSKRMVDSGSGFEYWIEDAKRLPAPVVDFGGNLLAVEFLARLPWVIPEQP